MVNNRISWRKKILLITGLFCVLFTVLFIRKPVGTAAEEYQDTYSETPVSETTYFMFNSVNYTKELGLGTGVNNSIRGADATDDSYWQADYADGKVTLTLYHYNLQPDYLNSSYAGIVVRGDLDIVIIGDCRISQVYNETIDDDLQQGRAVRIYNGTLTIKGGSDDKSKDCFAIEAKRAAIDCEAKSQYSYLNIENVTLDIVNGTSYTSDPININNDIRIENADVTVDIDNGVDNTTGSASKIYSKSGNIYINSSILVLKGVSIPVQNNSNERLVQITNSNIELYKGNQYASTVSVNTKFTNNTVYIGDTCELNVKNRAGCSDNTVSDCDFVMDGGKLGEGALIIEKCTFDMNNGAQIVCFGDIATVDGQTIYTGSVILRDCEILAKNDNADIRTSILMSYCDIEAENTVIKSEGQIARGLYSCGSVNLINCNVNINTDNLCISAQKALTIHGGTYYLTDRIQAALCADKAIYLKNASFDITAIRDSAIVSKGDISLENIEAKLRNKGGWNESVVVAAGALYNHNSDIEIELNNSNESAKVSSGMQADQYYMAHSKLSVSGIGNGIFATSLCQITASDVRCTVTNGGNAELDDLAGIYCEAVVYIEESTVTATSFGAAYSTGIYGRNITVVGGYVTAEASGTYSVGISAENYYNAEAENVFIKISANAYVSAKADMAAIAVYMRVSDDVNVERQYIYTDNTLYAPYAFDILKAATYDYETGEFAYWNVWGAYLEDENKPLYINIYGGINGAKKSITIADEKTVVAECEHDYVCVEEKEATTTETGYKKYQCSQCYHSYEEIIDKQPGEQEEPSEPEEPGEGENVLEIDRSTGNMYIKLNGAVNTSYNGWYEKSGKKYWADCGKIAQDKQIYDPESNAWYWFDKDGTMAVDKDVYVPESNENRDNGKWVRYDANGGMVKGEDYRYGGWYYFDPITGEMTKGYCNISDGTETGKYVYYDDITGQRLHGSHSINGLMYYFDDMTGAGMNKAWIEIDGKQYWYENGIRQGYNGNDSSYRGKEIYDEVTDAWYWLDNIQGGAKAVSKNVYQESNGGKWVCYNSDGEMVKGWHAVNNQKYYFDLLTGAMLKGWQVVDGQQYYFDEITGVLMQ